VRCSGGTTASAVPTCRSRPKSSLEGFTPRELDGDRHGITAADNISRRRVADTISSHGGLTVDAIAKTASFTTCFRDWLRLWQLLRRLRSISGQRANGFPEAAEFIDQPNIRHELEDIADRPDRAKKRSDRFAKQSAF
jgi:hypothetical protein